ncbi:hypothetical protein MTX26_19560 [Bradyrhizobium sp. ISRA443]|uniref:hypothetical protein n=1 Tax=unclassified Bradyrhizobium TaxID=2631580 RepID=UPI002479A133|nr:MULTISPECIES: hypothetical protein [unclassified Bradyrhizobium]WGR92322.1 hypothetical protein MTX20_30240 [Bradyrhizobium sp. ISRA435]WGR96657.1 hypothetical protein MTX23_19560 [Bradyrhizobium sp. ISRA436]WGS03544.1 hypothetical protein MTX18_19560 [Bradyrhizobium sp. ISRA437]WGS10428.1 hypothetical protein MTX26_19560 [Bradyrhizobium sp. ISRA443]
MLEDGTYAAWFKTPLSEGTGVAHVANGKIWGRDSITTYSGSCEVNGDRFVAVVTTERHTDGHETVFGVDRLTLRLEGTCAGNVGKFTATADEVPGMILEGTLIRSEPAQAAPAPSGPLPPFNLDNLPKLPKRSR